MSTQILKIKDIQVLNLEITSHCNVKCPQCSRINEDGELAEYVTLKNWSGKIIDNLELDLMENLKFVLLEGDTGDALMHPDIVEIVGRFYDHHTQPKVVIFTNGALRSEDWWKQFGARFPDRLHVQFSIDGLEDTHQLYRVGADYKKLIKNVRAFIKGGGNAGHRCIVFKHNEHQLDEIADRSREIGFHNFQFMLNDAGRFRGLDRWPVMIKGQKSHYIESTSLGDLSRYTWGPDIWNPYYPDVNDQVCPSMKTGSINITYRGHVLPCCVYNADLYFDHPMNRRFRELVQDPDLVDLNKHRLSAVLEQGYFHRLEDMLSRKDHPGRCNTMCSHLDLDPSPIYFIQATQHQ
jgi:MoaA/NifB/PqqE/SkfB family radical SAM enzyme